MIGRVRSAPAAFAAAYPGIDERMFGLCMRIAGNRKVAIPFPAALIYFMQIQTELPCPSGMGGAPAVEGRYPYGRVPFPAPFVIWEEVYSSAVGQMSLCPGMAGLRATNVATCAMWMALSLFGYITPWGRYRDEELRSHLSPLAQCAQRFVGVIPEEYPLARARAAIWCEIIQCAGEMAHTIPAGDVDWGEVMATENPSRLVGGIFTDLSGALGAPNPYEWWALAKSGFGVGETDPHNRWRAFEAATQLLFNIPPREFAGDGRPGGGRPALTFGPPGQWVTSVCAVAHPTPPRPPAWPAVEGGIDFGP
jgi:hypothetical protein